MSWCEIHAGDGPRRVLVLQGGGALGSYQAGVYEALNEACFQPVWVAGTSIGAINGAIIAGNRPQDRVAALRRFWERVTGGLPAEMGPLPELATWWHQFAGFWAMTMGAPGFFRPHWPPPLPWLPGPLGHYDTAPLRETLDELVDWTLLNSGTVRLSVGAVDVETGNFRYFDTETERLGPEHVMASGALPPGFAPVRIEGSHWWDGGIVSNTPLEHVLDSHGDCDLLVIQVDLFPARGALPASIAEAEERVADIRFSSRTRLVTNAGLRRDRLRRRAEALLAALPEAERARPEAVALAEAAGHGGRVAIGQLVYRDQPVRGAARGREFSRATMRQHWAAGRRDMEAALPRAAALAADCPLGISSHDLLAPAVPAAAE